MPVISGLKGSRTRENKALLKEVAEAKKLLQAEWNDSPQEVLCSLMTIGKVLINLEVKLTRLENVNEKLVETYEQTWEIEAIEQFQTTLDEESESIEEVITTISELKILKEESEEA